MSGNDPYVGPPSVRGTGTGGAAPSAGMADLTPKQRTALRASLSHIAARTREYLPDEYAVGSEITRGADGARAMIAVRPPIGNPVSAGFEPEFSEEGADPIGADEQAEVARGLAASAALQMKQALGDDIPQHAR